MEMWKRIIAALGGNVRFRFLLILFAKFMRSAGLVLKERQFPSLLYVKIIGNVGK